MSALSLAKGYLQASHCYRGSERDPLGCSHSARYAWAAHVLDSMANV